VKILVGGTGGVGGYFGARLANAGRDVWFLARGNNLQALRAAGLTVRSEHGDVALDRVQAVESGTESGPVDAVLFCVKTYDNGSAAEAISGAISPQTAICSLQNGVENEAYLTRRFPQATVLGGVTRIEAFLESPGIVVQRGALADLEVGPFLDADRPAAEALVAAFDGTPVPARVADDITAALWTKLLIIAGIGGVTAFCRCPIGQIKQDDRLRKLLQDAMEEAAAVAAARGITVPPNVPDMVMVGVTQAMDPGMKSSMCRDAELGRPLEVEAINGAVVRFGDEADVPTPANRTILDALLPLHRTAMAARERAATGD
jgi:2-dehydropantoate 2-reductase